jgi:HEAT repeat protein
LQDPDENKRKAAAQALAKTFKENERLFTLITNTLAKDKEISDRWRGFRGCRRFPPPRQPRRTRGCRCAGGSGARGLSRAVASLLCAQGEVVRQGQARSLGSQCAAAGSAAHDPWVEARDWC